MHVMVLGAGLAGVTTAWYLVQAGFQVTVLERRAGVGLETSFANGGQISISHPMLDTLQAHWYALNIAGCTEIISRQ